MDCTDTREIEELGAILKEKGLKLALAESCTGGLLGSKITSLARSSDFFNGGIISYHNSVKIDILGVKENVLGSSGPGAVSKECAEQMAQGARRIIKGKDKKESDIGVSITGTAGPGGGTDEKPVGTVFIALSNKTKTFTEKLSLIGERNEIREQSALMAIRLIIKVLRSEPS